MRQAVILVGGRGTRLGEQARDVPKPLVPIAGDVRFLDYLLLNFARHGVEDILLLAGHLAHLVEQRYAGKTIAGARVRVIVEPEPAGTAGALRYAGDALHDTFFMTNGDSFLDMNYLALGQALGPNDVGAMALRRVPDGARFGRVETLGDRVTAFREKDTAFQGEALISAGTYLLRRSVLDLVTHLPCSIETDVFPKLAAAGALAGVEGDGYFIDIGLPETLSQARSEFPAHMRRGAVFFDRDGTLTVDEGYTHKPEVLAWQPGAIEAIRRCNDAGRLVIVVTNQSGVARGYYSEADVETFHAHMQDSLRPRGAHIDAFYACPYHGDGIVPEFSHADHPDRKPAPGMIRRALAEWPIDPARSFLVGDSDADLAAAAALGLPAHRVAPGELLGAVTLGRSQPKAHKSTNMTAETGLRERAATARAWLFDAALPLWWDLGYDRETRSFHEKIGQDGTPASPERRVRVQARQTIVYARAGRLGWTGPWRDAVAAGAEAVLSRCLRADGGTRHLLGADGQPLDDRRDLYDLAFVLLALSEASVALKQPELIAKADEILAWTNANWALPQGGFAEGEVTPTPPHRQNPHMHMFEALLALHEATGQQSYLDRASAIAALFHDKLFDPKHGALPEYFDAAWRPMADDTGRVTEPGHHFEWSWLLHRWNSFGGGDLGETAERLRVHGETYGVNLTTGAVYDEIWLDGRPRTTSSRLWPHTERLKANLVRFERTRDPAAAAAASQAHDTLMRYCAVPRTGLWRDRLNPDGSFVDEAAPASSFYHIMFGMFELLRVAEATK